MVGAVGLTESAKGDLKAKLATLGTNLIIAQAGGTFGSQNPTFPADAVQRVETVSTVTAAAGHDERVRRRGAARAGGQHLLRGVPGSRARRRLTACPRVLKVPVVDGRWLNSADNELHAKSGRARLGARQAVRLPAG